MSFIKQTMQTDIYNPELWNSFFMMVGGGAAALTGLIFVAMSLKLEDMTNDATHKYRSINTLAGLTAIFVSAFGIDARSKSCNSRNRIIANCNNWSDYFLVWFPSSF